MNVAASDPKIPANIQSPPQHSIALINTKPNAHPRRLRCLPGTIYRRRACTVEPVFGIIKSVLGFRQFLLRGWKKVSGEWNLVCLAYNLKRLHVLQRASGARA